MKDLSFYQDQLNQRTARKASSFLNKLPTYLYELTKNLLNGVKFLIKTFLGK